MSCTGTISWYDTFTSDGLAWDWISEKIYWTDNCNDDIVVFDPATGYRATLFDTGLVEPHAIVVDPTTK